MLIYRWASGVACWDDILGLTLYICIFIYRYFDTKITVFTIHLELEIALFGIAFAIPASYVGIVTKSTCAERGLRFEVTEAFGVTKRS